MKVELLAPAGNLEKLKIALHFGADAVYLGGKSFSLRTFADNFSEEELQEGVNFAHERGKKVYVAVNIFAKNSDFSSLPAYFQMLEKTGVDGVLVADLGVMQALKQTCPNLPVHISTQANNLNAYTAKAWQELGASRVVLARELSVKEIAEIHAFVPDLELEAFVHGAMCISYSGRCYLSDYLDGRISNRGACVQSCRWNYRLQTDMGGEGWYDVEEDGKGAYVMNSKDLNMSEHLQELEHAGICSFKIEGRMKSEYYLATVVNAYRRILDNGYSNALGEELSACAHRAYTTAYAFEKRRDTQSAENSQTKGSCEFIARVLKKEGNRVFVEMRNRFYAGEALEVLSPSQEFGKTVCVKELQDEGGAPCEDAKRVQDTYSFVCDLDLYAGDILRRRNK